MSCNTLFTASGLPRSWASMLTAAALPENMSALGGSSLQRMILGVAQVFVEKALESQPAPTPLLLSSDYTLPFGQDFWQFCNMSLADTMAKFGKGVAWAGLVHSCLNF